MIPPSLPFPRRRNWLFLAAGLALLYVCFLGSRGLSEPDEGRYANISAAMATPGGGGWWEPRVSGYGHYDKPPLIYWTAATCFRAFGVNEWAARLPSLLGAGLALVGIGWAAFRLRGARVAWWAVLVCGTTLQFWTIGHILSPDMLLTGWCTLAIAAWAECRHRGGAWGWWFVSLGGWTLAWWTKASPALVPLAGLAAGVWLTGDDAGRRALRPALTVVLVLALGSPWYLSMMTHYPELHDFFFKRELAGRLAGRVDGRHGSVVYYVPISLLGWLPWWPVAAWRLWQTRRKGVDGSPRNPRFSWVKRIGVECWIVLIGGLVFSLASSKLPTYTLPLAPWAALAMARVLARETGEAAEPRPSISRLMPGFGFAAVALVALAVLPPRYEAHLGVNTSIRDACRFVRAQGATRVDLDHYWPSAEFYLQPPTVHYLIQLDGLAQDEPEGSAIPIGRFERIHERSTDPGLPPHRFVDPEAWPALPPEGVSAGTRQPGGWWFIRFHVRPKPKFDALLGVSDPSRRPVKVRRFGDVDVYHLPDNL